MLALAGLVEKSQHISCLELRLGPSFAKAPCVLGSWDNVLKPRMLHISSKECCSTLSWICIDACVILAHFILVFRGDRDGSNAQLLRLRHDPPCSPGGLILLAAKKYTKLASPTCWVDDL